MFPSLFHRASNRSDPHAREIAKLRLRIVRVLTMRNSLQFFFAWIMVWAVAVVGLRAIFRVAPAELLWGSLGLVLAFLIAFLLADRQTPSTERLRATLDRHGELGGLLMSAGDGEIGSWNEHISQVPLPVVRWRSGRQWKLLLMSAAFLGAAFLMPDAYLPAANENTLEIGGEMQKLTEKMEVLKEQEILPPEKAATLEKDLERIRQEALGKDPAKTLEALDHLEQSFNKAAAEAAESAVKQMEKADQAQKLAEALEKSQDQMDPKQFGDAMQEMAQMAAQAAAENEMLGDKLSDELKEACKQGKLSEQQLKELAESLKKCSASQRAKLGKMVRAKLIDGGEISLCDKEGCNSDELAAMLCECKNGQQLGDALSTLENGDPGRGGISRGRGDAAMTWSEGAEQGDAAFKEKVLPPASVASLKESQLAGMSVGDPTSKEETAGSTGGVLDKSTSGGGESRTQVILPEHKKTIQRYFERERK
jgi:hypothetical protein